jgi:hypothetical protein
MKLSLLSVGLVFSISAFAASNDFSVEDIGVGAMKITKVTVTKEGQRKHTDLAVDELFNQINGRTEKQKYMELFKSSPYPGSSHKGLDFSERSFSIQKLKATGESFKRVKFKLEGFGPSATTPLTNKIEAQCDVTMSSKITGDVDLHYNPYMVLECNDHIILDENGQSNLKSFLSNLFGAQLAQINATVLTVDSEVVPLTGEVDKEDVSSVYNNYGISIISEANNDKKAKLKKVSKSRKK